MPQSNEPVAADSCETDKTSGTPQDAYCTPRKGTPQSATPGGPRQSGQTPAATPTNTNGNKTSSTPTATEAKDASSDPPKATAASAEEEEQKHEQSQANGQGPPKAESDKQQKKGNSSSGQKASYSQSKSGHYASTEEGRGAKQEVVVDDDEEDEAEACMHPLHMGVFFFSIISVIFCIVALYTAHGYVIAEETTKTYGLFRQCVDSECGKLVYEEWVTPNCTRTTKDWKNRNLMSSVAVIIAASCCLFSAILSCLGKEVGAPSYLCIVTTALSFVFLALAVLRFVYTYEVYLYCDMNYCDFRRSFGRPLPAGCDASFGYSFAFLVIAVGVQLFATIFAIMRVCFKDWHLTKKVEKTNRVVTQSRPSPPKSNPAAAEKDPTPKEQHTRAASTQPAREDQQAKQASAREMEPIEEKEEEQPRTSPQQERSPTPQHRPRSESPQRSPANRRKSTPQPQVSRGATPRASEPLPPGNWSWDEECQLYWSEEEFLYLDPNTRHYYDPNSDQWYDPDTQEWYFGEEKSP